MVEYADPEEQHKLERAKARIVREQSYLEKVANAIVFDLPRVAPWLTATCPECRWDLDVMPPNQLGSHTVVAGAVIVGCEDYWVIDPKVLFPESATDITATWGDWRYDPGGPLENHPLPGPEPLTDAQKSLGELSVPPFVPTDEYDRPSRRGGVKS